MLNYKSRFGQNYSAYRKVFKENNKISLSHLKEIQRHKYAKFIKYVIANSKFYKSLYAGIEDVTNIDNISKLPIISKEHLRANIGAFSTIAYKRTQVFETGGTTGKALKVAFTKDNLQERFAMLDNFRSEFGYELGKKTAWFSGNHILGASDVKKKRFWKTDYFYKIRYYSTFHIKNENLSYYLHNLITFNPAFLVGYPSSMIELAEFGLKNGFIYPSNNLKAIFPTAESFSKEEKENLELFFKVNVYDQYASTEGAPFIIECRERNLHTDLQSGVFEILDDKDQPSNIGRLVVTSFTTYGTPLIRYNIGDTIELKDGVCPCGNQNPMVEQIFGRENDFIYSHEKGKLNLINVSNTIKKVDGIIKFQVEQNELTKLIIRVVVDKKLYNSANKEQFIINWKDRLGTVIGLDFRYVDDIPVEKSGKYRLIKNNIKHLI